MTPHPSAQGRHPLPTGEGKGYLSFSRGEKVAEERGRMRGLVIPKMFAKKTRIYGIAMQNSPSAASTSRSVLRHSVRTLVRQKLRAVNHLPGFVYFRTLLHCPRFKTLGEIISVSSPNLNTDEVPSWQVLITDESS